MNKNVLSIVENNMLHFSKGQKRIGIFILEHFDKAAFMTASKLGITVGVSESTVVRFASELGFGGYPQLQQALQEMIRNRLTAVQRMEVTNEQIGGNDILDKVLNSDIEKIRKTMDETNRNDFNCAVESITNARNIYIIGVRSASALANFLSYYFNLIFENIKVVSTTSISEVFERILNINEEDVLIGISFPRYSNKTVKAMQYAKDSGAKVIAITDSKSSPIAKSASHLLLARSDMASFVDSLVAPLSLINALIVAVGLRRKEEVAAKLAKLEHIWEEYEVYEKTLEQSDLA